LLLFELDCPPPQLRETPFELLVFPHDAIPPGLDFGRLPLESVVARVRASAARGHKMSCLALSRVAEERPDPFGFRSALSLCRRAARVGDVNGFLEFARLMAGLKRDHAGTLDVRSMGRRRAARCRVLAFATTYRGCVDMGLKFWNVMGAGAEGERWVEAQAALGTNSAIETFVRRCLRETSPDRARARELLDAARRLDPGTIGTITGDEMLLKDIEAGVAHLAPDWDSVELLEYLAERGKVDLAAEFGWGCMALGHGLISAALLRQIAVRAAEAGVGLAQLYLGFKSEYSEACKWLRKAAQGGIEGAAHVLGQRMVNESDWAGALAVLRAEVDRGSAVACVTLARVLGVTCRGEGAFAMLRRGRAVPIPYVQAASAWFGIVASLRGAGGHQSGLTVTRATARARLCGLRSFDDPFPVGRDLGSQKRVVTLWIDAERLPAKVELARALWLRSVAELK
jgi:TPR repeat protein